MKNLLKMAVNFFTIKYIVSEKFKNRRENINLLDCWDSTVRVWGRQLTSTSHRQGATSFTQRSNGVRRGSNTLRKRG